MALMVWRVEPRNKQNRSKRIDSTASYAGVSFSSSKASMRNVGLDLLRFVAIALVVGRHLHMPETYAQCFEIWKRGGWVGVDLFFVLSGFLIASLLFREFNRDGKIDMKRFLIRRGFKIYPAFWLFLAATLAVRFMKKDIPPLNDILGEVLFLQNYIGRIWGHTWSLAVEEHFYIGIAIVFALLLRFRPKDPFKYVPALFVTVALSCLGFRILNLFLFPEFSNEPYRFWTHVRADALMFGVLIAYLTAFHKLEERLASIPTEVFIAIGILLFLPASFFAVNDNKWMTVVGEIGFYIGGGAFLLGAIRLRQTENRMLKLMAILGTASYSIYLWHWSVATWGYLVLQRVTGVDHFVLYLLNATIGALIFGWVMNWLIERPVLMIREALFPSNISALSKRDQPQPDGCEEADEQQSEPVVSIPHSSS